MTRVPTSNYGADPTTQFSWATVDEDAFDRTDVSYLAQAVENHNHGAARGLAVARLATGAVDAAALAALSVGTTALANLSVTNAKLAAGAVTRDKITWPLVQFADNMPGGFTMRDTTNTYAVGFYVATNGLSVFGSGTIASIPAGLIIDQSARTSIGPVAGTGKLNVFQAANTQGSGIRIYHTDQNNNVSMYMDAALNMVWTTNVTNLLHLSPSGFMTLGPTFNPAARLYIVQAAGNSGEGFRLERLAGAGLGYVIDNGAFVLQSLTTAVQIEHANVNFAPLTNGGTTLGRAGMAWGAATVAALTATTGTFSGAITGASYTGGALSGTTGTFSGAVSMGGALTGVTTINASGLATVGNLTTAGTVTAANVVGTDISPPADDTGNLGSIAKTWGQIHALNGYKPGGGTWSDPSDDRLKDKSYFRPYTVGLETLLQLKPTYYRHSGDYGLAVREQDYVGLRAQEVQDVAPEMLGVPLRAKRTPRSRTEDELLTVDTSRMQYMMLNALKELNDRVSTLESHEA